MLSQARLRTRLCKSTLLVGDEPQPRAPGSSSKLPFALPTLPDVGYTEGKLAAEQAVTDPAYPTIAVVAFDFQIPSDGPSRDVATAASPNRQFV